MKSNNQINVPQAREAGSVGDQMVGNGCPGRTLKYTAGYVQIAAYIASSLI